MLSIVFAPTSSWSWFWFCHLHMYSQTKPHAVPSGRLGSSSCSCNDRLETSFRVVSGWRLGSAPRPDSSGGLKTKRVASRPEGFKLNMRDECPESRSDWNSSIQPVGTLSWALFFTDAQWCPPRFLSSSYQKSQGFLHTSKVVMN